VTLSDALPVQFWLASQETYNEKDHPGVFSKCFCHPWESDDVIKVQFLAASAGHYKLFARNSDEYLVEKVFSEIATGVYYATLTPSAEGILEDEIQLVIADAAAEYSLLAPSGWSDVGASVFDSKTATTFTEALTSTDSVVSADMPLVVPLGTVITIVYTVEVTGTWTGGGIPIFVSFSLKDGSGNTVSTGILSVAEKTISANGTYQYTDVLTATDTSADLDLDLVEQINSGTANVVITLSGIGDTLYVTPTYKSDCLDIKSSQDETVLITYSDNKNFASLNYSLVSPDPEFTLRIPAIFFHERFPEESEVIELSNSRSIQLNAQVKAQRWLQIKPMPYYMHRKMKLVLKHQFVTIDDQDWVQSELYELIDSSQRSPMKKATVWLTEKDYLLRNVL